MSNARQAPLVPPQRYRTCTQPAYACSPQVATLNNNGTTTYAIRDANAQSGGSTSLCWAADWRAQEPQRAVDAARSETQLHRAGPAVPAYRDGLGRQRHRAGPVRDAHLPGSATTTRAPNAVATLTRQSPGDLNGVRCRATRTTWWWSSSPRTGPALVASRAESPRARPWRTFRPPGAGGSWP
jgi:hypothetical protein